MSVFIKINDNENKDQNKKISHRYDKNRASSRHGHKQSKYTMCR